MGKLTKGGTNQKVVAAAEKKAVAQSAKDAKAAAAAEAQRQKEWSDGANLRGQAKADSAAAKADEAAKKRAEKAALLAQEEEILAAGGKAKNKEPTLSKKGKNKKNDDLSMLEGALVGAAEKKVKAQRQADRLKEQKQKEEEAKKKEDEKPLDPLLANTNAMIAGTEDELVGRAANQAAMSENHASGIDGALESLNLSSGPQSAPSAKALFKAFEERMLPEVKADYPGLKLSQYKEKVFQMWKKSPENPANHAA